MKRKASSTVPYQRPLHPPHTDDMVDTNNVTPSTLIGNRISKQFHDGIFAGTIVATWTDDNHIQQWRVKYDDDDDGEDLTLQELCDGLELHKIHPLEHLFAGIIPTPKILKNHTGTPEDVLLATVPTSTSHNTLDVKQIPENTNSRGVSIVRGFSNDRGVTTVRGDIDPEVNNLSIET